MNLHLDTLDLRKHKLNTYSIKEKGFVLYWMQTSRRLHYNFSLDYAVQVANKKNIPLLIYGGIDLNEPFINQRTWELYKSIWHNIKREAQKLGIQIVINLSIADYIDTLLDIAQDASIVVSDLYPISFIQNRTQYVSEKLGCALYLVDSCGMIPMNVTVKAPYSAYIYRKKVQQYFELSLLQPPKKDPIKDLHVDRYLSIRLKTALSDKCEPPVYNAAGRHIPRLPIELSRERGQEYIQTFVNTKILQYETDRNHPDKDGVSNLSSFLSTGVLSVYDVVFEVLKKFPEWSVLNLGRPNGKNRGFFGLPVSIESFFDELICWREIGFHYNYHSPGYDRLDDLPNWVQTTLLNHSADRRDYTYTYEELENAQTHDPVWNAAQQQLIQEGRIHNYLRMLWGKKIIEWTSDYQTALQYMISLNNNYALDGRDPASYAGIFWCFGRFDRAWPEHPVLGKLRYMSSESTKKKIQLKKYLVRFKGKENN